MKNRFGTERKRQNVLKSNLPILEVTDINNIQFVNSDSFFDGRTGYQ